VNADTESAAPVTIVSRTPVPMSSTIIGVPQT
jgi:hypothetical protein